VILPPLIFPVAGIDAQTREH